MTLEAAFPLQSNLRPADPLIAEEFMPWTSSHRETDGKGHPEGRYANFFKVGHNAYEFVIDFGQSYADDPQRESIHSRVVTSPAYAKVLLKILQDAIGRYDAKFGSIIDAE
ncbi:hypothetical protein DSCO28_28240 [Desulfosarcina ovata subsp. sediminis]|uniref:DUF3467 domain-containing protein n=1 Tax=Desulfosarcina ovata subsp. sediminis TaxID=885957 RepID=A0A5K7ZJ40_9BACT|nr:DUF3467 domain-containing protein [Desulfosarcina ovata]BBO82258.1 hypothetical protein DSCO28_28240 [Desulfosarcina ovata subsp. sediminis]